ncbi:hypothetical protein JCM17823_15260 [Halorubrum gandharaense]
MSDHTLDERWQDVLSDTDATVEEYRDRGWDALALHPGNVNPVSDAARIGVLLPGSEFDELRERMDAVEIDTFRVYAAGEGGVDFRLVVAEDSDREFAVCVPTFLVTGEAEGLREAAVEAGGLTIRLRPLDDRDVVELTLTDLGPFFEPVPAE